MELFEVKVRYSKVLASGKEKKVTEPYLFDAESFSDAENRMYLEAEKFIQGDFKIVGIKASNIGEVLQSEGSINYKAKVNFVTIDEEKGVEKKVGSYIFVPASDVEEAYLFVNQLFEGSTSDYEISGIVDSKIINYFPLNDN